MTLSGLQPGAPYAVLCASGAPLSGALQNTRTVATSAVVATTAGLRPVRVALEAQVQRTTLSALSSAARVTQEAQRAAVSGTPAFAQVSVGGGIPVSAVLTCSAFRIRAGAGTPADANGQTQTLAAVRAVVQRTNASSAA